LIFLPVIGQTLPAQGNKDPQVVLPAIGGDNSRYKSTFMGQHPFQPYLVQKVAIGHPEGTIGIGLMQGYKPHPLQHSWQNQLLMQPVRGLPQYPYFVLHDISPSVSRRNNAMGNMQSFSMGQLDGKGIHPQFRQVRIVKGFPIRRQ
jgi:hypothetical protein